MSNELKQSAVLPNAKILASFEIVSVVLSWLIAEWMFLSFFRQQRWLVVIPLILAFGLILLSHLAYNESVRDLGFRLDNLLGSLRSVLFPTLIAVVAIVAVGWYLMGPPVLERIVRPRYLLLPAWALLQQYALQAYINRRAQIVCGRGFGSILLVAIIFALLHLPNPVLFGLTLMGGFVWAALYQREANLFALAASHTVVSLSLALAMPLNLINGLRVGFKYFG